MNEAARILPQWLLAGSMGWIAGFGQAGSAFFPFITGAISQRTTIRSFPPMLVIIITLLRGVMTESGLRCRTIAMTVFTILIWAIVLRINKIPTTRET